MCTGAKAAFSYRFITQVVVFQTTTEHLSSQAKRLCGSLYFIILAVTCNKLSLT